MLNRNSFWKNLLVLAVVTFGFYYAAPNLYAPDPALQIAGSSSTQRIDERSLAIIERALDEAGITYFGEEIQAEGRSALIRLNDSDAQLRAQAVVGRALGDGYIVALNLAPTTPDWLVSGGASPMKLGLDLSGGVHFKLEVDVDAVFDGAPFVAVVVKVVAIFTDDHFDPSCLFVIGSFVLFHEIFRSCDS